jgi:hypothetical protein
VSTPAYGLSMCGWSITHQNTDPELLRDQCYGEIEIVALHEVILEQHVYPERSHFLAHPCKLSLADLSSLSNDQVKRRAAAQTRTKLLYPGSSTPSYDQRSRRRVSAPTQARSGPIQKNAATSDTRNDVERILSYPHTSTSSPSPLPLHNRPRHAESDRAILCWASLPAAPRSRMSSRIVQDRTVRKSTPRQRLRRALGLFFAA